MRLFATRPAHQNTAWSERLNMLGLPVIALPCLEIQAIENDAHFRQPLIALDEFNKVIAISQNAVEHGFNAIEDLWPQLPTGIEWFGIGRRTREMMSTRLKALSAQSEDKLMPSGKVVDSESMLALPALQNLQEQKILILRGEGGREHLRSELHTRGARVEYCELYRRVCPQVLDAGLREAGLRKHDVVAVFSGESLQNFYSTASLISDSFDQTIDLVVPGQRVARIAHDLGFKQITVAKDASEDEVFASVQKVVENT